MNFSHLKKHIYIISYNRIYVCIYIKLEFSGSKIYSKIRIRENVCWVGVFRYALADGKMWQNTKCISSTAPSIMCTIKCLCNLSFPLFDYLRFVVLLLCVCGKIEQTAMASATVVAASTVAVVAVSAAFGSCNRKGLIPSQFDFMNSLCRKLNKFYSFYSSEYFRSCHIQLFQFNERTWKFCRFFL